MVKLADQIHIEGVVTVVARERGKVIRKYCSQGKNIWTLTGREYITRHMSYKLDGANVVPERNDRIRYMGVGTGVSPQVASVIRLATPVIYSGTDFLAEIQTPPTYPSASSVRYSRIFAENEISIGSVVLVQEFGLFTDGDPASDYEPLTRDVSISAATEQAPNAYYTIDPIPKTTSITLEVIWEIRA